MASRVQLLHKKGLIGPPKWLPKNVHYEVLMGSVAYGVSSDTSDMDVYGFCIPPKEEMFPHLAGEIPGFGTQKQRFEQYQQHHIMDTDASQEYDFAIYSIAKFFHLCMENNPNMCDSLFVPQRCVLYASTVGTMVRDNRKMFLHKGSYHKYRGYAYASLHKLDGFNQPVVPADIKPILGRVNVRDLTHIEKEASMRTHGLHCDDAGTLCDLPREEFTTLVDWALTLTKHQLDALINGYSTKFAYHIVRLALEAQQILIEHDLDIEANREILKSIRRGEWTKERLRTWFNDKEKQLEDLYVSSTLRHKPDEDSIHELLMNCLEHHYGSLDDAVKKDVKVERLLSEFQQVIDKYK